MKETIGKKAAFAAIAVLIMLAIITAFCATAATASATEAEAQGDYIAENWTAMPADDFTKCDKGNTSSQSRDYVAGRREIQLTGGAGAVSAGGGSAYLSSVFYINPETDDYTDFTFTMTFRASYYLNDARWFGIMYRMQKDENDLPGGYIFTNRMNTRSAYTANVGKVISGVTGGDNGFKDTEHTTAKNAYTDGKYHTVTITMQGNTAKHWVDGKLIGTAVTTDKDAIVGGHDRGGFAILVSQCTINIKSCSISRTVTEPNAQTEPAPLPEPSEYAVSDFTEACSNDWILNSKSLTAGSSKKTNANGELVLKAGNTDNKQYYGGLFTINAGATYGDFTFEMAFKVTPRSWHNLDRWFGVVYRANYKNTDGTTLGYTAASHVTGYVMQYRVSGKNAYSSINNGTDKIPNFKDDGVINAGDSLADGSVAPALTDGAYHTLSIKMTGNTAKHYIDGHLVREAQTSLKDGHLGKTYDRGGFALIVNAMELNIKSVKITPAATEDSPQAVRTDNEPVTPYQNENVKIVNAPTVVCDVTDSAALNSLSGAEKPSNAILHLNGDCNVVSESGEVLGGFGEIYASLNHAVIPVAFVADNAAADALINYLQNTLDILDMAVMSDNAALVKKVRTACPRVRGIVSYKEEDLADGNEIDLYGEIVANANENYANVAAIPQSVATAQNVRYIQARFKTVWAYADSTSPADLYSCVNGGAYGIIASDFGAVYDILETYPQNSHTRMPYNVAHRGAFGDEKNPAIAPTENSIGAAEAAIAMGASHLELDVHLSKDGRIVVMHDTTIDRTTTGTGNIGNMTLAEIRNHTLKDGQQIPVLEEVFAVLEEHKEVVLVLELKAGATIVQKIDELIGTGEGQYDVRDQLVIISFNNSGDDLLTDIKTLMPSVPTALLTSGNKADTFVYDLASMGHYNCVLDMGYNNDVHQASYNKEYLTDRGITSWYWTFNDGYAIVEQAEIGHVGVTNNMASVLQTMPNSVEGIAELQKETLSAGDTVSASVKYYDGTSKTVNAKVFYCEKEGDGWKTVVSFTFTTPNNRSMTLFSEAFVINETPKDPEPNPDPTPNPDPNPGDNDGDNKPGSSDSEDKGGCFGSAGANAGMAATALLCGATYILLRKRKSVNK